MEQDHMIERHLPRNDQLYNLPASQDGAASTESSPEQTSEPPCLALESWPMGLGFRVCIYHFKYGFCPFKNQLILNRSLLWRLLLPFIEVRDICISIYLSLLNLHLYQWVKYYREWRKEYLPSPSIENVEQQTLGKKKKAQKTWC